MPRPAKTVEIERALDRVAKHETRLPGNGKRTITPELDAALHYLVRWKLVPDRGAALLFLAGPMAREIVKKVRELGPPPETLRRE